jgi:hypothetical protein
MDPLSIAASSFSLAGGIAKASIAIVEFTRDARDAAKDLDAVFKELQALTLVLEPLTRALARARGGGTVFSDLVQRISSTLEGCLLVVDQINDNVHKYQRDRVWTKAKWVMFGQGDMHKLRESLEAYKMALSLGLHAISL